MDIFSKLAERIIEQQEGIIGPIALEQAKKVKGIKLEWTKHEVTIEGNKSNVLEDLVQQYKNLFGQASVEACKQAVRGIIQEAPKDQIPSILK